MDIKEIKRFCKDNKEYLEFLFKNMSKSYFDLCFKEYQLNGTSEKQKFFMILSGEFENLSKTIGLVIKTSEELDAIHKEQEKLKNKNITEEEKKEIIKKINFLKNNTEV